MVSIDFNRFHTESEFRIWLTTEEGYKVMNYIYDIVISAYRSNIRHIPVITKKDDTGTVYSIDMQNLSGYCKNAIRYFEITEEYEKCSRLLEILNSYKKC